MNLREHFAAMAMQGVWANPQSIEALLKATNGQIEGNGFQKIAYLAVKSADALIAELKKSGGD